MIRALCLSAFAMAATSAVAQSTPAELDQGLAGTWSGALGYRDYQSNKLEELPVSTTIEVLADGVTSIRVSRFNDGPKVGAVYITSAALHDLKAGTVTTVSLRKGRPVESSIDRLTTAKYVDPTHWTVIAERDGEDGDKSARIRTTESRDGNQLLAVKEVMPAGTTVWAFRNQTHLTRTGAQ